MSMYYGIQIVTNYDNKATHIVLPPRCSPQEVCSFQVIIVLT
jgi:hypothetical protein